MQVLQSNGRPPSSFFIDPSVVPPNLTPPPPLFFFLFLFGSALFADVCAVTKRSRRYVCTQQLLIDRHCWRCCCHTSLHPTSPSLAGVLVPADLTAFNEDEKSAGRKRKRERKKNWKIPNLIVFISPLFFRGGV